jgi:hypothetical protein
MIFTTADLPVNAILRLCIEEVPNTDHHLTIIAAMSSSTWIKLASQKQ